MDKPSSEEVELLHSQVCSALADTTRVAILYELAGSPCYVSCLVEALGQPQGTVSRHLKILRERGLVVTKRSANKVLYQLRDRRVIDALDLLRSILHDQLLRQGELAERLRQPRRGSISEEV